MIELTDRFPKAFQRFEKKTDISDINTLDELMNEFRDWGGKKAPITRKQRKGLAIEGIEKGIDPIYSIRWFRKERDVSYITKTGKTVTYHQSAKFIEGNRNALTGKFSGKPKDRVKELK